MAEKYIISYENAEVRNFLKGSMHFWGISQDVGWGCTNHWADVMLVQYMLSAAWFEAGLTCDGIFGPKTAAAIKSWQKAYGPALKADGKIDAVNGSNLRSSVSKTIYTMLALNEEFVKYMSTKYDNIKTDPKLPPELRSELTIRGGSGGSLKYRGVQTMVN